MGYKLNYRLECPAQIFIWFYRFRQAFGEDTSDTYSGQP